MYLVYLLSDYRIIFVYGRLIGKANYFLKPKINEVFNHISFLCLENHRFFHLSLSESFSSISRITPNIDASLQHQHQGFERKNTELVEWRMLNVRIQSLQLTLDQKRITRNPTLRMTDVIWGRVIQSSSW